MHGHSLTDSVALEKVEVYIHMSPYAICNMSVIKRYTYVDLYVCIYMYVYICLCVFS